MLLRELLAMHRVADRASWYARCEELYGKNHRFTQEALDRLREVANEYREVLNNVRS